MTLQGMLWDAIVGFIPVQCPHDDDFVSRGGLYHVQGTSDLVTQVLWPSRVSQRVICSVMVVVRSGVTAAMTMPLRETRGTNTTASPATALPQKSKPSREILIHEEYKI